jgi:Di-haem oxidoreductase, putative peroxidase
MTKRKLLRVAVVWSSIGVLLFPAAPFSRLGWAQLGSNIPTDAELQAQRASEIAGGFVVEVPVPGTVLRPVERVPRARFGVVGPLPLRLRDLDALVFPDATSDERQALLEGLTFFTTPHTPAAGVGPLANQTSCQGCHLNSNETIGGAGLVVNHVSNASRAARSTPTNFRFTSGNSTAGGRPADNLDAINDTGRTEAFTIFGDYSPATNIFDPLDGSTSTFAYNPLTGSTDTVPISGQQFGGFVQHTRPSILACLPDRIPTVAEDQNLGVTDPVTGLSASGFRRAVSERAGPPYIGRGLMEAIPTQDLLDLADHADIRGAKSSLNDSAVFGCEGDCVTGRHNEIPPGRGGFVGGVGRFGLRANGAEMLQFVIGGLQGELSFTSLLNGNELNLPDINIGRPGCMDTIPDPEVRLSTPFSERNFLRMTAPPEFGNTLLALLESADPSAPQPADSASGRVQRGAMLFGIDLSGFANRMIPDRMPEGGDGRDPHAINQADRLVGCVSCHTPVQRTGLSPAIGRDFQVVARHLSFVWAPIFADLLLHEGPVIDAERFATTPRDPLPISRADHDHLFQTFDLPRNLADDAFSNQQATAFGPDFRTAPLMGLGRIGPPFLHDGRVYLSRLTRDSAPAGTVMTNSEVTNAPLVVRTLDDAIRAAIELHDLPAPDDQRTPNMPGAGCPVPPDGSGRVGNNVDYGPSPAAVICPPYDSRLSHTHRSEAREVIRRFRALSPADQQALIDFLKEL